MKDLSLLVFFSQLGLAVALPLTGFVLLGAWLRRAFDLGVWVVILGALIGAAVAFQGLRDTLKTMDRLAKKDKQEPPAGFNEHD